MSSYITFVVPFTNHTVHFLVCTFLTLEPKSLLRRCLHIPIEGTSGLCQLCCVTDYNVIFSYIREYVLRLDIVNYFHPGSSSFLEGWYLHISSLRMNHMNSHVLFLVSM
jgi:hypothetical protein